MIILNRSIRSDYHSELIESIDIFILEKSGCDPNSAINLVKHILNTCQHLEFIGLMTIGMFGYDYSKGPNPDFLVSLQVKS